MSLLGLSLLKVLCQVFARLLALAFGRKVLLSLLL